MSTNKYQQQSVNAVSAHAEDVAGSYYTLILYGAYGIADAIRDNSGCRL